MKTLPWVIVGLLAFACGAFWAQQTQPRRSLAENSKEALQPEFSPQGDDREAKRDNISMASEGANEAIAALTQEIRGLRADLAASRDEGSLESALALEIRTLLGAIEKQTSEPWTATDHSPEPQSYDLDYDFLDRFDGRLREDFSKTARPYILRTQQDILREFGVPTTVWVRDGESTVQWSYEVIRSKTERRYFTFKFIDGQVMNVESSR